MLPIRSIFAKESPGVWSSAGRNPGLTSSFAIESIRAFGCRTMIVALACGLFSATEVRAGALDWLNSRKGGKPTARKTEVAIPATELSTADLPGFFKTEVQPDITGQKMNVYQFVESHWVGARKSLESTSKSINAKIPEKKVADISKKLYAVNAFSTRESLKSAATTLEQLGELSRRLQAQLGDLARIITAPREETLANLEKAVSAIQKTNQEMFQLTKAQIAGSESLIDLGSESYQTLELVPLLSINPVDLYVRGSKQFMKQIQSSHEALKGLLLNIQNSSEQVVSGMELMGTIVTSTLKYSDHFAFRQYPLVNLPVPTREKLFAQVGAVQNIVKGVDNTLSIGESHVKNSAQQFTHQVEGMCTKIQDALQYMTAVDLTSGNLPQISVYAHNQVSGLYQRTREGLNHLKMTIAKVGRATSSGVAPVVSVETRDEANIRQGQRASSAKLPLFLLGGKAEPAAPTRDQSGTVANNSDFEPLKGQTMVLYSEKRPRLADGFKPEELDILRQELGDTTGLTGEDPDIQHPTDALIELSGKPDAGEDDLLGSFQPGPEKALGRLEVDEESAQVARSEKETDESRSINDMELSPMDTGSLGESSELLPMLKLDDPLNLPDLD